MSKTRRRISKVAVGDQHGIFQHFQSNTTDYATRERYQRGGEAPIGRDTESLYNIAPEGDDSRVPTEYVAPHLSTRYSPDRIGVQAQRVSDGVYQDPYTNKVYDYNEGFKTEDGRSFPGGSASLQSSLSRMASVLDAKGLSKEADRLDGVLKKVAASDWDWAGPEGRLRSEDHVMDIGFIIKNLVIAHRDPESGYKLSEGRLRELTPQNLTEDERQILEVGKTSLAHMTNSLVAISNTLDSVGFDQESNELDLTIKSLASHIKAQLNLSPIVSVASSLDDCGLHDVSDLLDTWMSKNR